MCPAGGGYFHAASAEQLRESLRETLKPQYEIRDRQDGLVGRGRLDGPSVELLPGEYRIVLLTEAGPEKWIEVLPGESSELIFPF